MAGYADNIRKDIDRWAREGLISADVSAALAQDVEARYARGFSFGYVLAMMAALLFCAAILIVVAANWEAIPRLGRVAALFVLIAAGYIGGAVLKTRGHDAYGEGSWLIAAAAFGGSIALISQMYHLSGDETQAILLWCVGTALAAVALRSPLLTVAAVALAAVWAGYPVIQFSVEIQHWFLLLLAVLWAVSMWTGSVTARHAILLSLVLYAALIFFETDDVLVLVVLAAVSAGLVAAVALQGEMTERLTGLGVGLAVDGFAGFLAGMFMLQVDYNDRSDFGWLAAITFAGIVATLIGAGRLSRGLRWLAYLGFAAELCLVYVAMVGTMLGTAGFFLMAGVGIGLLAFLIIRIERRLAAPAAVNGAAS